MNRIELLCILLIATYPAGAVQPIASITSASPFELRGHIVNVDGVPTWPIAAGDDIAISKDSASLQFRDGSRVILLPVARFSLDFKDDTVLLRLSAGSLRMGP